MKNWLMVVRLKKSFEEIILDKLKSFIGKSDIELAKRFNIKTLGKHYRERIIANILGVSGMVNSSEEFQKANITLKTIRVEQNGKVKESMSFKNIDFNELNSSRQEDWEDSNLYHELGDARFLFVVFKNNGDYYILSNMFFFNLTSEDLDELKIV
jgi:DNA mismatch repair protein MutH